MVAKYVFDPVSHLRMYSSIKRLSLLSGHLIQAARKTTSPHLVKLFYATSCKTTVSIRKMYKTEERGAVNSLEYRLFISKLNINIMLYVYQLYIAKFRFHF